MILIFINTSRYISKVPMLPRKPSIKYQDCPPSSKLNFNLNFKVNTNDRDIWIFRNNKSVIISLRYVYLYVVYK